MRSNLKNSSLAAGTPEGECGGAHQHDVAGFVLAHGLAPAGPTKGEGKNRQKMVENDLVDTALRDSAFPQSKAIPQVVSEAKDNMIVLPGQLFYTTTITVCLWFLTKNKKPDSERGKLDESASLASSFPIAA